MDWHSGTLRIEFFNDVFLFDNLSLEAAKAKAKEWDKSLDIVSIYYIPAPYKLGGLDASRFSH